MQPVSSKQSRLGVNNIKTPQVNESPSPRRRRQVGNVKGIYNAIVTYIQFDTIIIRSACDPWV